MVGSGFHREISDSILDIIHMHEVSLAQRCLVGRQRNCLLMLLHSLVSVRSLEEGLGPRILKLDLFPQRTMELIPS